MCGSVWMIMLKKSEPIQSNPNICGLIWIGFWLSKVQHVIFLLILISLIHRKIIGLIKNITQIY